MLLLTTFLLLLFPDGHPPSPRWRWVAVVAAAGGTLAITGVMRAAWPYRYDLEALAGDFNPTSAWTVAGFMITFVAIAGSIASLIVRFRRSAGDDHG